MYIHVCTVYVYASPRKVTVVISLADAAQWRSEETVLSRGSWPNQICNNLGLTALSAFAERRSRYRSPRLEGADVRKGIQAGRGQYWQNRKNAGTLYTESQALNRIIQTTNKLNDLLETQCKWTNNRQNYFSSINGTTNRERFSWIFIYVLFLISVLILDQRYSVR